MFSPCIVVIILLVIFESLLSSPIPSIQDSKSYEAAIHSIRYHESAITLTSVDIVRPFSWASSALLVTAALISTLTVSIFTFWKMLQESRSEHKPSVFIWVVIGTLIAGILWEGLMYDQTEIIQRSIATITYSTGSFARPGFTRTMNALLMWEIFMIIAALCSLASPLRGEPAAALKKLLQRKRLATSLLYLSAALLTFAVVQINLVVIQPGNAQLLNVSESVLKAIGLGAAMLAGTFFTLLLAAMYAPTALILHGEAYFLADRTQQTASEDRKDKWLTENGLVGSGAQTMLRIAAMISPILAGWLGEPVAKAMGAVFQ